MLAEAIAELLPVALAVALAPLPIVAVTLLLGGPDGPASGVAFALGWVAGLAAVTSGLLFLAFEVGALRLDLHPWSKVAIGLGLLAAGAWKWRTRPRRGELPRPPAWLRALARAQPGRSCLVGLLFGGPNPKNLALALIAVAVIAEHGLEGRRTALAVAVFVAVGSATVAGAALLRVAGGRPGRRLVAALEAFMLRYNNLVLMLVFVLIGLELLGDGLAALAG